MALSFEENETLTRVGPGTPGGEMLRRYWHPIGFTSELKDRPKRRRLLGEDLVLFRDERGRLGLLALQCLHRGTSLEFGHIEDGGLRCCYHGWLYDVDGRILEQPAGTGGFGYDPYFFSDELQKSFGEATPEEKDGVSHRGRAVRGLAAALERRPVSA